MACLSRFVETIKARKDLHDSCIAMFKPRRIGVSQKIMICGGSKNLKTIKTAEVRTGSPRTVRGVHSNLDVHNYFDCKQFDDSNFN